MRNGYLAAIDIGTTGTKTGIFDLEGKLISSGYKEYECTYPKPNWVEQDPEELLEAVFLSAKEAIKNADMDIKDILSIGLSTQRCSPIFIDKEGKPLKMISWQDNRTGEELKEVQSKITNSEHYRITGLPLGTTWISSKIMWFKKNEPELWKKTSKVTQVQDYILKALGADDYYLDNPEAVFYGFWDTDKLEWNQRLMDMYDIDVSMLPNIVSAGTKVGVLSQAVAVRIGFSEGTPICVGLGDQNSAAVGAGIVKSGNASVSIGTGGMAVSFLEKEYRDPSEKTMVTNHAIDGKWQLEGLQAGAAGVFRWFRDEIATLEKAYAHAAQENVYEIINKLIEKTPVGAKGLLLLPYLASSTAPRWNPNARGTLVGLTFAHDRGCLARAFVEGITMEQKDILISMSKTGVNVDRIRIIGGATKSELWNQIQADMYNIPVETLETEDAALVGAAIMAGLGVDLFEDIHEGVEKMVRVKKRYDPIARNVDVYNKLYEVYCKAYKGLTEMGVYDALTQIQ